jgi:hypothetical protein
LVVTKSYRSQTSVALTLRFLLLSALVFGQQTWSADQSPAPCKAGSLPPDFQNRLKTEYGSWKVQEAETLSEHARKTWAGKMPPTCPGIAVGLFQGAKTPSYAVLLVPVDHPDAGYRFLVFSRKTGQPSYEAAVVEQSDDKGASNYFIRKVAVSRFFNEASKRKSQVQATEAILMVDSAETEYEADLYFWSNDRFQQHPFRGDVSPSTRREAPLLRSSAALAVNRARQPLKSLTCGYINSPMNGKAYQASHANITQCTTKLALNEGWPLRLQENSSQRTTIHRTLMPLIP